MKATSLFLGVGLSVACFGQLGVIAQGNLSRPGYLFSWQSRVEPPSPPLADPLGYGVGYHASNASNDSIYRVMIDRTHHMYFGYEVRVEPREQGKYRLTFSPLTMTADDFKRLHMDEPEKWNKLEIPTPGSRPLYPFREDPDTVHDLDVVAVDLLVNPTSRQKIVDYVVLQRPGGGSWTWGQWSSVQAGREFSYPEGDPRDFAVEDAALRIANAEVALNGMVVQRDPSEVSGAFLWFSIPDQGRYIFTVLPQPGFQKAGEVRGSTLRFTFGRDTVVIQSARPIASRDTAFNLYVRFDGSARSAGFALAGGPKWELKK
jgi:hypothetical protein